MPKLPVLKSKELVKILNKMGFFKHHQVGSHAQFKHSNKRRTTIPIHSGKDIASGTLKSILRDIEISVDEFIAFLKK
ncbi:MAG: type II toxin-antitoxin system HicA family toxin [bacterium]|nr:type II toxin-antitoxin system HicA family toxin [bacterium]